MGLGKDVNVYLTDQLKSGDVNPHSDLSFIVDLGSGYNVMADSLRHSWECQNVDVHAQALSKVMSSLVMFVSKLHRDTHCFLKFVDNLVPLHSIETHLIDFDMLTNKDFDGLQLFRKCASINPKNYAGSPLVVNLRMYNMTPEKHKAIKQAGHFLIKGEGELNYVKTDDVEFSHITDFDVKQLCFKNLNQNTEQVLFQL